MKQRSKILVMLLLTSVFLLPGAHADPIGDSLIMCYSADEAVVNQNTVPYNQNLTSTGSPSTHTAKIGTYAYDAPDNDNSNYRSVATGNAIPDGNTNLTICAWHYLDSTDAGANQFYLSIGTATANGMLSTYYGTSPTSNLKFSDGDTDVDSTHGSSAGRWYQTCIIYDASAGQTKVYRNTTLAITHSQSITRGNDILMLGQYPGAASFGEFDGGIDEVMVFNKTLSTDELAYIYNGSSGISCAYLYANRTIQNTSANTITVNLFNNVTGVSLGSFTFSNVTGTLNFTYFNITTGGFCANYTGNGTGTNCTVTGSGTSTFFAATKSQVITGSDTVSASTSQALLDVRTLRLFLNTTIASFNATNNQSRNTTSSGQLYLAANNGTNNVQIDVAGNYSRNVTCTVSAPLTTVACNATDIHDAEYAFNATDIWNDVGVNSFTLQITNITLGGLLYSKTTTNGSINVSLLQGYQYFVQFTTPNGTFEYVNVTLASNSSNQKYEFEVLPAPSIDITIRDTNGNLITQNITITLTSNTTGDIVYTVSGGYFATNLTPEEYVIKLDGTNYSQSTYVVSATEGNVYFLTAYLQGNTSEVVMQFVDSIASTVTISGASASQQALVNGSWVTISSKLTDITGRTTFGYEDDIAYRFIIIKDGYDSKTFTLDPVLFSTYTIKLTRSTSLDTEEDFQSVYVDYSPKIFYDGQQNQVNITFLSPLGTFTSYSYLLRYPGGSATGSGTSSNGETFTVNFTITGASFMDRVNVTLTYDATIGDQRSFNYSNIIIVSPGNTTFISNQDNTYGLGLLERLLIGTLLIIFFAGLITMAAGGLTGLIFGLFIMGLWIYIGFWPWWGAGLCFLVGFALFAGRTD